MAKWEAQFNQIMNSQRDGDEAAGEYGEFANQLWNQEAGTYDWSDESKVEFDNEGLPIMGNYTFGMYASSPQWMHPHPYTSTQRMRIST